MPVMDSKIRQQVEKVFADLTRPVRIVMFTQGEGGALECEYCQDTRELVEEVASVSDKITVEVRDFVKDEALAKAYGIDKLPAMAIMPDGAAPSPGGIRLYGVPAGYEFTTLIESVRLASSGETGLSSATLDTLKRLTKPVRIQVFVTPTCPYCPRAVVLAHKLAMANPLITADMVEVTEFPHLGQKYHVHGVPRTVIDETVHVEGAVPEAALVAELMKVLQA